MQQLERGVQLGSADGRGCEVFALGTVKFWFFGCGAFSFRSGAPLPSVLPSFTLPSDGSMALFHTLNAPAFTTEKKAHCDIKFVKWLVRKNRVLTELLSKCFVNEIIMIIIKHLKKLDYQRA
jgi:hypothetical protein